MAEVRKKMGWTQDDLAREAVISRNTVNRLERGRLKAYHPYIQQCMRAMKLTPEVVELIMNPHASGTATGQKGPAGSADMDLMRREMDVLMRQYPLLDLSSRSVIMSVVWMGMRHPKGEEQDLAAITAPLTQEWKEWKEWNSRILDVMENPDPDWKAALDLVDQTASEDAPKHTEVPATQTEVTPERTKDPATKTETAPEQPSAPSGRAGVPDRTAGQTGDGRL